MAVRTTSIPSMASQATILCNASPSTAQLPAIGACLSASASYAHPSCCGAQQPAQKAVRAPSTKVNYATRAWMNTQSKAAAESLACLAYCLPFTCLQLQPAWPLLSDAPPTGTLASPNSGTYRQMLPMDWPCHWEARSAPLIRSSWDVQ